MQQVNHKQDFDRYIKELVGFLPSGASADAKSFAQQFFDKLPAIDLAGLEPKRAAKIAATAYEFLGERKQDRPKVRISSQKAQTVIEMLNDDMPFLVDSVAVELARLGMTITRIIHPIVSVKRGKKGELTAVAPVDNKSSGYTSESFIYIEASRLGEMSADELEASLTRVLDNVRLAVHDWAAMRGKIAESVQDIQKTTPAFKSEEITEVSDFLDWLAARNFVFLGYIEYDFYDEKGNKSLRVVPDSELGIFRMDDDELKPKGLEGLPPEVLHFALIPQLIEITKSMRKAVVHRPVHMDYIGLKRFDSQGKVIGERRFLGLFTSNVYKQGAGGIPFLRRKIARVLSHANFDPASHDGKSLRTILEFTPCDELFQFSEDDLYEYAMGVLSLETRPRVRLFARKDIFERFVSCTVFLPRDRYSSDLREEVQNMLAHSYDGKVSAYYTQMTDSPLVRLQLIINTRPAHIPKVNIEALEARIAKATHRWSDALSEGLKEHFGEDAAEEMMRVYANAFPKAYVHSHDIRSCVYDINKINDVMQSGAAALELFRSDSDPANIVHLKWYNPNAQVPLSDVMPILENIGFKVIDEQPYQVKPAGAALKEVWIRDFILSADAKLLADIDGLKPLFEAALSKVWQHEVENDKLGALVLSARFAWREVQVLRAYAKYLKQVNFAYGFGAIAEALNNNPAIARAIFTLFDARFNPSAKGKDIAKLQAEIEALLADVSNIADDRILRRYVDIIMATLRTNYYQPGKDGKHKPYISFKFDSSKVPELPLPRPYAEIFVYSARVEGIHLRGGKVARGGLRWSDRRDDFRTEILGLMKAQMVKNSVIVPVGSKGGFVLKQAPTARDAMMEEGVACYKIFLSGLLDLTDNIVDGKVVPPKHVVRHDDDDPYLVVAADKGTATFSDYANSVSKDYGFWLDDAFASGGSVGYDHKKMGITARGGFISVERHFREMGIDIHKEDFTVVGIGDMAGDVFGNGMLLSKHIRLVGAFNHMHIFLDPNPDAASSFKERKRMFNLPRSSWKDYDASLISQGGGIFERSAKSIKLSPEVKKCFGIEKNALSPDELIRAMLVAPVDLLWNGGIGTYVKAEDETNEQVGDRTNNALRVNGRDLNCKVVGEGGNLGLTQKGRIEYAQAGGRINTDAIDNSAGVDCSDHEVNIKIGFGGVVASGKLAMDKRDTLLASMTDEVGMLVLKDNQLQTQALTIAQMQAPQLLDEHIRLMHTFESRGELDRVVEFLPSDKQLVERKNEGRGLVRPELAVLLAYSKMALYPELLKSSLPDDPYFANDLISYFPEAMRKEFAAEIKRHPLRREIIATVVTNDIINRTGITLVHRLSEESGLEFADVARALAVTDEVFGLRALWQKVEALDGKIGVAAQVELFRQITAFTEQVAQWFLRNTVHPLDVVAATKEFAAGIKSYASSCESIISEPIAESYKERQESFLAAQVPAELAAEIARLDILSSAPDVVLVSNESKGKLATVGELYFRVGAALRLDWLRQQAGKIVAASHWDRLAVASIIGSLFDEQRRLTLSVLDKGALEDWQQERAGDIERFIAFMDDLKTGEAANLPKLVIAEKKVKEIGR
ncbi:MAG TPA: NAD-glutamate dehydrogenase [Rickettsiales bacterium]|nr:NAD-glutamate dehydrogenase [Rickettsiales bacterium]